MKILNFEIVDFFNTIYQEAEGDILEVLYDDKVPIDEISFTSKYFKLLFFNMLSKQYLRDLRKDNKHFFIIGKPTFCVIYDWVDKETYDAAYNTLTKKFVELYPINALIVDQTFEELMEDEEVNEYLTTQVMKVRDLNSKKSFKNLSEYVRKNDLAFVDKQVFSSIQKRFLFA